MPGFTLTGKMAKEVSVFMENTFSQGEADYKQVSTIRKSQVAFLSYE